MSALPTPAVFLCPGLEIGYGKPLARVTEEIKLANGTHFLLARNGRGKTTLLRTLARTIRPVSGDFEISGAIQYLPEDLRFDHELPAKLIFRSLLPGPRRKAALELAERIELDTRKPYGRLSTGNRRKTSLIVAEYSIPADGNHILLLDEPFSGLDAFARQSFEEIWAASNDRVLRLVSCHPDYDGMPMPSALLIESGILRHQHSASQTWTDLKRLIH